MAADYFLSSKCTSSRVDPLFRSAFRLVSSRLGQAQLLPGYLRMKARGSKRQIPVTFKPFLAELKAGQDGVVPPVVFGTQGLQIMTVDHGHRDFGSRKRRVSSRYGNNDFVGWRVMVATINGAIALYFLVSGSTLNTIRFSSNSLSCTFIVSRYKGACARCRVPGVWVGVGDLRFLLHPEE